MRKYITFYGLLALIALFSTSCIRKQIRQERSDFGYVEEEVFVDSMAAFSYYVAEEEIVIREYFSWIKEVANQYDSLLLYHLDEKILIHANPWLIDTFAHSDYYYQKARGKLIENQREYAVIQPGDSLKIPSQKHTRLISSTLDRIRIDVNLPEYKLRLWEGDSLLYIVPIRIGQDRRKYLATEGREFNLRTKIGKGTIVNILEDPHYTNFSTGEIYKYTRRDDGKTTRMPQIPTLEPEINGICYGQLIHPTTNPNSLGKAYSHGCIGTGEEDAWRLYFYVRPGTPIEIRYDLNGIDEEGNLIELEDVYHLMKKS